MAKNTWETTQEHFQNAFNGLLVQAVAHDLDIKDKKINAFLVYQAEVLASRTAGMDFYANIVNQMTMGNNNG